MTKNYQNLGVLADGGMAEICLARRIADGQVVAVKRIKPSFEQDAEYAAMFEDEGRLWARLRHPNIVRLLDRGVDEIGPYLAMELVDGLDLAEILDRRCGDPLPLDFVLSVGASLCEALDYLHTLEDSEGATQGLVHRDVSPGNLLCGADGAVKLTDFGVVQAPLKTHQTRVGDLKGKFAYMSPEQTRGEELTSASDLFSAGIVLWEMLSGCSLFDRATDIDTAQAVRDAEIPRLGDYRDDVDDRLDTCVRGLLARDAGARPRSAAEVSRVLRAVGRESGLAVGAGAVVPVVSTHLEEVGRPADRATAAIRRRTRVAPGPGGATRGRHLWRWAVASIGIITAVVSALYALGILEPADLGPTAASADAGGSLDSAGQPLPASALGAEEGLAAGGDVPNEIDGGVPRRVEAGIVERRGPPPRRAPDRRASRPPSKVSETPGGVTDRGYGTLDLRSDPWAKVAIDGVDIGRNTPLRNFPISAGRHRVTLHNPVFKITKTVYIEVKAGERVREVIDLTAR